MCRTRGDGEILQGVELFLTPEKRMTHVWSATFKAETLAKLTQI